MILGPIGLGVIAQFLNFQSFLTGVICLGIPVGITTIVAQNYLKKNFKDIQSLFITLFIIMGFLSTLVALLLIVWANEISIYLLNNESYSEILIIFMIVTPFLIQFSLLEAYLKGIGKINLIVKINVSNAILTLILVYPLVYYYQLAGAALLFVFSGIFPLLLYVYWGKVSVRSLLSIKRNLDVVLLKNIIKIGVVSLASSFLFQLSMIQLRKFIIEYYGIESAGIYQSVLGLSSNYFILVYTFLSIYSLPQFSRIEKSIDLVKELNNNYRFILFILVPMAMLLISFRGLFLQIFYSSDFLSASNYFYLQIIGDIFRAMAALFGLWLIPRFKILALLLIDATLNLLLLTLPYLSILFSIRTLEVIPLIYMTAFVVHFILYYFFSKFKLGFKLERKTVVSVVVAIVMSICCLLLNYYNVIFYEYIVIVILLSGSLFVFDKEEKRKVIEIIQLKFNKSD